MTPMLLSGTNTGGNLCNSVFVGICASLLCTAFSTAAALFLATRRGAVRLLCMALLLITMVSPPFVSSLAYIQLYGRRGWIAYRLLGLSWDPYNCWGVILMQSLSFVPLNALFLGGILTRLDGDSIRAARDLGASPRAILGDIVLPLIRPGIWVALLLSFVRSLADLELRSSSEGGSAQLRQRYIFSWWDTPTWRRPPP